MQYYAKKGLGPAAGAKVAGLKTGFDDWDGTLGQ
jgi:hypothetical protein